MTERSPCHRRLPNFRPPAVLYGWVTLAVLMSGLFPAPAQAQTTSPANAAITAAEAARPPVKVAVFVSTRNDVCYDPGNVGAVRRFVKLEQERINKAGGVGGRRLDVDILDDANEPERAIANLSRALTDRSMLAMIGLTNSQNAGTAFKELGDSLDRSGIPLLSDIALSSTFAKHPTVYSTRPSLEEDRLAVAIEFIRTSGFQRVAYIGFKDREFSTKFADAMKAQLGEKTMVSDVRLSWREPGQPLDPAEMATIGPALEAAKPDLVIMLLGTERTAPALKILRTAKITSPVLMFGRIEELPADVVQDYPADLFQLALDGLPEVYNDRMRQKLAREAADTWLFEGRKNTKAPGWSTGLCKERPAVDEPDPLEARNQRAISFGTQYADMLALVAAAAVADGPRGDLPALRKTILRELQTTYAAGRGAFKGSFETWSFDRFSRAASKLPQVVIRPRGLGRTQLAPVQFARLKSGGLKTVPTLYADVDLIRVFNVDDGAKTFSAELYLSMRVGDSARVEDIEFANAYLDPRTNGRQITITPLHEGGPSGAYPDSMKVYKVSGRFMFEPDLANYPYDSQRFAIAIQPRKVDASFIVQPPPLQFRDRTVGTDGWNVRALYVGHDSEFVPVVDAFSHEPSVVPFYTASYAWLMQRQTTDYSLRVIVPLAFILVVAYLSIFIPQSHFEAIVTIQVTALLSAVALYLSQPQLGSDVATVSDRLFVFVYMMVSLMIAISIVRVNRHVAARKWLRTGFGILHVTALPAMVVAMAWYVQKLSELGQ